MGKYNLCVRSVTPGKEMAIFCLMLNCLGSGMYDKVQIVKRYMFNLHVWFDKH